MQSKSSLKCSSITLKINTCMLSIIEILKLYRFIERSIWKENNFL